RASRCPGLDRCGRAESVQRQACGPPAESPGTRGGFAPSPRLGGSGMERAPPAAPNPRSTGLLRPARDRQAPPALLASSLETLPPGGRSHPREKSVGTLPPAITRLISSFHLLSALDRASVRSTWSVQGKRRRNHPGGMVSILVRDRHGSVAEDP